MGISSSKENLNLQLPWDALVGTPGIAEKRRVQLERTEASLGRVMRDLHALLPPKLGESSSTDQQKERDTERDEEVSARLCQFMKGGACKESFTALLDCIEENNGGSICYKYIPKLLDCLDAHSDYYQPVISLAEYAAEQIEKDELVFKNSTKKEELPKKHANRWLRRFW